MQIVLTLHLYRSTIFIESKGGREHGGKAYKEHSSSCD